MQTARSVRKPVQALVCLGLATLLLAGRSDGSAASPSRGAVLRDSSSGAAAPQSGLLSSSSLLQPRSALRLRGGGLPFRYTDSWSEIVIRMPIDENIKGKDVVYKLTPTLLDLGIKGKDLYVTGELWGTIKIDDSLWEIESDNKLGRCVTVHLKKANGQKWDYLLKSEDVPPDLTVTEKCYMDIKIGGEAAGRVTVGLYGNVCPRTCFNFRALCTGETAPEEGKHKRTLAAGLTKLTYKNTQFHRVIPNFMIQAGDFTKFDGTGGESVYGGKFEDENFQIKHTREGLLSMANAGADCNGAQFFITTASAGHLDGKHVVFGAIVEGYDIIKKIEDHGTNSGKPKDGIKIEISDCGVFDSDGNAPPPAVAVAAVAVDDVAAVAVDDMAVDDMADTDAAANADDAAAPEKVEPAPAAAE